MVPSPLVLPWPSGVHVAVPLVAIRKSQKSVESVNFPFQPMKASMSLLWQMAVMTCRSEGGC